LASTYIRGGPHNNRRGVFFKETATYHEL